MDPLVKSVALVVLEKLVGIIQLLRWIRGDRWQVLRGDTTHIQELACGPLVTIEMANETATMGIHCRSRLAH
ncbi:hypothetical protein PSACC_01591 [Paramicrosporidium saccamoebae]|uniref:Uncharacterized protein n=1 Tax=Paramicrosporidium saccamoebae TaxID=1246581 RepID=A0A2H9TLH8_9FUNG|nr:hypothetical protein PSACC_01591 [Paramicrosporidium saccamoebae]